MRSLQSSQPCGFGVSGPILRNLAAPMSERILRFWHVSHPCLETSDASFAVVGGDLQVMRAVDAAQYGRGPWRSVAGGQL